MQYILTQEEYDNLKNKEKDINKKDMEAIRRVLIGFNGSKCITDVNRSNRITYCDDCPVTKLNFETRNKVCTLNKEFSQ